MQIQEKQEEERKERNIWLKSNLNKFFDSRAIQLAFKDMHVAITKETKLRHLANWEPFTCLWAVQHTDLQSYRHKHLPLYLKITPKKKTLNCDVHLCLWL